LGEYDPERKSLTIGLKAALRRGEALDLLFGPPELGKDEVWR